VSNFPLETSPIFVWWRPDKDLTRLAVLLQAKKWDCQSGCSCSLES
jgi:hypothetical protein